MRTCTTFPVVLALLAAALPVRPGSPRAAGGQEVEAPKTKVYVPYRDLSAVIDPAGRAVLMDRDQFARLLAAAQANARTAGVELGQVTGATYAAAADGERLSVTGELTVVSMSDKPVAVPLDFARIALTSVTLDGQPAPLGYECGRLVLIVERAGRHSVRLAGSTRLTELPGGGMELAVRLPSAVAGTMTLSAPGDLEVHASVPVSAPRYDRQADRTTVELTVGGHGLVTVVLAGNGRQEDEKAILLGESATTVQLTRSYQVIDAVYTATVLRRGVRELRFTVPGDWTITDVACTSLVQWSVARQASGRQELTVRMRTASRGTKALHVQASAPLAGAARWRSGGMNLVDAAFQRGSLLLDAGSELQVRSERLTDASRRDLAAAAATLGLPPAAAGRLYYHWGQKWSVEIDLASVALRTSGNERQTFIVAPEQLSLTGNFEITAIGRELFEMDFLLPGEKSGWRLHSVTVNGRSDGFEYRLIGTAGVPPAPKEARATPKEAGGTPAVPGDRQTLRVELSAPVRPEGVANVAISLRRVPEGWDWSADASERKVAFEPIRTTCEKTSGLLSIAPREDLDVSPTAAPAGLRPVTVGRMASLGLGGDVRAAWTYERPSAGQVELSVTRHKERIAADSVGIISVGTSTLEGDWRIDYTISRARARTLQLLAAESLGRNIKITAAGRALASQAVVAAPAGVAVPAGYNLWQLTLDAPAVGRVEVRAHYDRPLPAGQGGGSIAAPLVRPFGAAQVSEVVAVQATEEMAVAVEAASARPMDAVELPALPVPATRLLAAYRLEAPGTKAGGAAAISLKTTLHEKYAIPAALVRSAALTTYVGPRGEQRTEARLDVANAGMQFLTFELPAAAQLWTVQVAGQQAKPKRSGEGAYLVSLPPAAGGVAVRIVYYVPAPEGGGLGSVALAPVRLPGLAVNRSAWQVYPPAGYIITSQQTRMASFGLFTPPPAFCIILGPLAYFLEPTIPSAGEVRVDYYRASPGPLPCLRDDSDSLAAHGQAQRFERDSLAGKQSLPAEVGDMPPAPPPAPPTTRPAAAAEPVEPAGPEAAPVALLAVPMKGRYTLPVDLVPAAGAGPAVQFGGLGGPVLSVGMTPLAKAWAWVAFGFILIASAGVVLLRSSARRRWVFIPAVLVISTLLAVWIPAATYFANGAFFAALALIVLYPAVRIVRWLVCRLVSRPAAVAAAAVILVFAAAAPTARAAEPNAAPQAGPAPRQQAADAQARPAPRPAGDQVVIPYEGDPTKADQADKVLLPYWRYVQLWNLAHPDQRIEAPAPAGGFSLADVRYAAVVGPEQMGLTLSARVKTIGSGWVTVPFSMSGLAVKAASLAGQPAQLRMGPSGMVLMLPAGAAGELKIEAVTTPTRLGRRGSVELALPPLPGAVMTVTLPEADLELEADGAEGVVARIAGTAGVSPAPDQAGGTPAVPGGTAGVSPAMKEAGGTPAVPGGTAGVSPAMKEAGGTPAVPSTWLVPLGAARKLTLRWTPKVGAGAADRTLSAEADHQVYFHQWAVVGVSEVRFAFSAGKNDRFGLLLPASVTPTAITGANLRDFSVTGEAVVDGQKFKAVLVRLHRPAQRGYALSVKWVGDLPAMDKPSVLPLPRAADVGRESGSVALFAAGGMVLKVADVAGGRRAAGAEDAGRPVADPSALRPAGKYYWPYRPFAITLTLERLAVEPVARLDQLVRIGSDWAELSVSADLSARKGLLFGACFAIPAGYDLLSATGGAVYDFYEQTTPAGRLVHVNFRAGVSGTRVVLVLVRKDVKPDRLAVPMVAAVDPAGKPLGEQTGRLAVQLEAALDARTERAAGLKPIDPRRTGDWLSADQRSTVRFAYEYEKPGAALELAVTPMPSKVRVEVLAAMTVQPTAAWYTCRLRYTITGSPIDRVVFTGPGELAAIAAVNSPAMRGVTTADAGEGKTRWTVTFANEVTGVVDVTVNFALPIEAETAGLAVPRISTEAPAGYRGIVAVQNLSRHELSIARADNLAPLAVGEQRRLLPGEAGHSLQYAYESFTDDWTFALLLKAAGEAARVQAVVDLMKITTAIDRDGRARYEVLIDLQNRSEQFLRVRVPAGLRLWSAAVAGQPVRPVAPAGGAAGEVLVPLTRTSPGGRPYQVMMYLAGTAGGGVGTVARLAPPAVAIVGMPVMRTTWSLRLPAGYEYWWPRGNVSPIAGRAEEMALMTEAVIEQAKRGEKLAAGVQSSLGRRQALYNLEYFNTKLIAQNDANLRYIQDNRDKLDEKTYDKLMAKLGGQHEYQRQLADNISTINNAGVVVISDEVSALISDARASTGQININAAAPEVLITLNGAINNWANNPGISEQQRNSILLAAPDFVQKAAREQQKAIADELKESQTVTLADPSGLSLRAPQTVARLTDGKHLLEDTDKAEEIGKIIPKLRLEQSRQLAMQQKQLESQFEEAQDNRLQRYYAQKGQAQGRDARAQFGWDYAPGQAQPSPDRPGSGAGGVTGTFTPRRDALPGPGDGRGRAEPADELAGRDDWGGVPRRVQRGGEAAGRAGGGGGPARPGDRAGRLADADAEAYAGDVTGVAGGYVPTGTYSLPVELPAGEVELHFARPGGDAEVSVWAVRSSLVSRSLATAALLAAVVLLAAAVKVIRRLARRVTPPPAGFLIAYAAAAVLLLIALRGAGLLIAAAIALAIEAVRRIVAWRWRRAPRGAAR